MNLCEQTIIEEPKLQQILVHFSNGFPRRLLILRGHDPILDLCSYVQRSAWMWRAITDCSAMIRFPLSVSQSWSSSNELPGRGLKRVQIKIRTNTVPTLKASIKTGKSANVFSGYCKFSFWAEMHQDFNRLRSPSWHWAQIRWCLRARLAFHLWRLSSKD